MDAASCRLGSDDVIVGLDSATGEHQAVVLSGSGKRLTRLRAPMAARESPSYYVASRR
jgi:hypothetical protein